MANPILGQFSFGFEERRLPLPCVEPKPPFTSLGMCLTHAISRIIFNNHTSVLLIIKFKSIPKGKFC